MHKFRSLFKFPITRTETNEEHEHDLKMTQYATACDHNHHTYVEHVQKKRETGEGGWALQCRAASATLTSVNFYIASLRPSGSASLIEEH